MLDQDSEELISKVDRDEIAASVATTIAELPKKEQVEIVTHGEKEMLQAAKEIRVKKAETRREEIAGIAGRTQMSPSGISNEAKLLLLRSHKTQ